MNWRHFLLASVVVVAPSAWAATLHPESTWAVTRVGNKAPGSAPYCALARRFENNIIMTFARNTRDETSIAIDFQQPVFTDDQSVQVNFATGVGEPREFLLKPASSKAVVARIGADTQFYKELEANNGMDVTVLGQDYTFVMPDMATANTQLNQCLAGLNYGAPADAGTDDKIAALQDQIQTLKTQRESMAAGLDTSSYSSQLQAAAGGENADLAQKISDLQMQNLALRDNVESKRDEYDNLQTKTLEDKSRLVLLEETQDQLRRAEEDTKKFRDELYTTQMRQDGLLQKLEKYSNEETKRKELEKHLEIVRAENEKLVTSIKEEKDRLELVKSAQDAMLAQQQQELSKTKEELAQTSTERDNFKTRLKEYAGIKDKLTALSTEQRALGNTVQALQTEKTELTSKLDAEKAKLEDIQKHKKQLEDQANLDKAEKEKLTKLLDEEKAKQKLVDGMEQDLKKLQDEQKELAAKVENLETEKKSLQKQVSELEGRVKKVEAEKMALVDDLAEVDDLAAAQSETIDTLTIKQKGLLTKVSSLEEEKNQLIAQLGNQKTQLSSLQTDSKKARDTTFEFDRVNDQLAALSKERDEMRAALKVEKDKNAEIVSASGDEGVRKLYSQVEELEYQRVDLNSALEFERARNLNDTDPAAGEDASTLGELKASVVAIQAERDEYKRLLDGERVRTKNLESLAGAAGSKETLSEMNGRIKSLETENVTLLRELEYERSRRTDVTSNNVNTVGKGDIITVTRLRDEVKRLQGSSKELETQQSELLAQVRMLEAEKQRMSKGQPVTDAAPQSDAEKAQLKAQIAALQAEKESLAQTLSLRDASAKTSATTAVSAQNANSQVAQSAAREALNAQREADALRAQLVQTQTLLATRQAQAGASPVFDGNEPMATRAPSSNVESELRTLLQNASIGTLASFGPVTIPVASDVQGWRWKVASLTGNAESAPAADPQSQSALIDNFLAKAKSRCPGDFAVIENSRTQSPRGLVVSTDIACVAGANGVAAAITFIQFGDRLVTIAHEAATADMPDAMAARDKIVQTALKE